MVYTGRDHVNQILREQKQLQELQEAKARKAREEFNKQFYGMDEMFNEKAKVVAEKALINNQLRELKESMLNDVIMNIFDDCFNKIYSEDTKFDGLKRNLVANLITTEGVDKLIKNFKYNSEYLATYAYIIETTYGQIKKSAENCDKKFTIDVDDRNDFIDKICCVNDHKINAKIQTRVSDAVEDFIVSNTKDSEEIKELLQGVQDKISAGVSANEAASLKANAQRKMDAILNKPSTSIFSEIASRMTKAAYTNPNMKSFLGESGKANMEMIIEASKVIYTFMEMLNTTKMVSMNEAAINDILKNIGK